MLKDSPVVTSVICTPNHSGRPGVGIANVALGRQVLAAFGPDRCMWGGNFPAELWHPKLTYAEHLAVLRDQICTSDAEREAVLAATPLRVWFPARC